MKVSTKNQILDAAELLFAEHGFADTSLRAITSRANVNLASVNYHFGSKKLLIQEVLQRYLKVLMPAADATLAELLRKHPQPDTQQVFSCLVAPLLSLNDVRPNGASIFVQLLGRGYTESQGHLRKYITHHYGDSLKHFTEAVHLAVPELPPSEIFWRLHFVIGTFVFTMASSKALGEISEADYQQQVDIKGIIHRLLPYISSGVAAPVASPVTSFNSAQNIA